MIAELRRRAYLSAMQVASWLPRVELPFAAPSRPELLQPLVEAEPEVVAVVPQAVAEAAPAYEPAPAETPVVAPASRPKIEVPRPAPQGRMATVEPIDGDVGIGAAGGAAYAISSRMIGGLERASLNDYPFSTICGSEAVSVVPAQFLPFPGGRPCDSRISAPGR